MNDKRLSCVQPAIMIYPAYTQIGPNVQAKLHWLKRLSTDQLLSYNLVTTPAREATKDYCREQDWLSLQENPDALCRHRWTERWGLTQLNQWQVSYSDMTKSYEFPTSARYQTANPKHLQVHKRLHDNTRKAEIVFRNFADSQRRTEF